MTYEAWMQLVEREVAKSCGMSVSDLPDCCFRDWYEDEMPAKSAARKAIRYAMEG